MSEVKSCGFLIIRGRPIGEFLLMRHAERWDLPKGHVDPGETELECALRELDEETGLTRSEIEIVPGFEFTTHYQVRSKQSGMLADKTLKIFLGRLVRDFDLKLTEHIGYQWFPWQPPHKIQRFTIDPLLAEVERYFAAGQD